MRRRILSAAAALAMLCCGCQNDVNDTYYHFRARYTMQNVYSVAPLHNACNSMGEFCTITFSKDSKNLIFTGYNNSQSYPITAEDHYRGIYLGMSGGLIVGLPFIPEMGRDESRVVCYDLSCPNCFESYNIYKSMKLEVGGYSHCPSCQRTYDLNSMGIVSSGDGGRSLFRYRVTFNGQALMINN